MERMFFFGSLSTIGFGLLAPHDSTNLSGVRVDGDGAKIVVFEFDAGRLLDFDRSVFDQFDQSNIREFVRLGLKDEEHAGREGDREQHRVEDEVESMVRRLFAFSIAFAVASIFAVVVVCHLVFGTEEWSCDALDTRESHKYGTCGGTVHYSGRGGLPSCCVGIEIEAVCVGFRLHRIKRSRQETNHDP